MSPVSGRHSFLQEYHSISFFLFQKFLRNYRICIYVEEYPSEVLPVDFRLDGIQLFLHIGNELLDVCRFIQMRIFIRLIGKVICHIIVLPELIAFNIKAA